MRKRSVAFATWSGQPEMTADDRLAAIACSEHGINCESAAWDDAKVDWSRFHAVVLRSTWNYHLQVPAFLAWLELIASQTTLLNPLDIVTRNSHKRYLLELATQGVAIPDTVLVTQGSAFALEAWMREHACETAVIKPCISADAYETLVVDLRDAAQAAARIAALAVKMDLLVQRFVPEVSSTGELSLMFFNGEFSHAVVKRPKEKDFRVQEHAGGTKSAATPPQAMIDTAAAVLRRATHDAPLYARVDGIATPAGFLLMELELIEPSLFFEYDDGSAARFAQALSDRLRLK